MQAAARSGLHAPMRQPGCHVNSYARVRNLELAATETSLHYVNSHTGGLESYQNREFWAGPQARVVQNW